MRLKLYSVVLLAAITFALPLSNKNQAACQTGTQSSGSVITIHIHKAGLFSGFGHNHTVTAPVTRGSVDNKGMAAEIIVVTQNMKVVDPDASEKDRGEIQSTMLGPKVLDSAKFPTIRFVSTRIEQTGPGHYRVTGKLDLHGVSRDLTFEVAGGPERYHGQTKLKQTDFGIPPISVAGGTIKVKDEIEIEFAIDALELADGNRR
jgi:hypothetical protein